MSRSLENIDDSSGSNLSSVNDEAGAQGPRQLPQNEKRNTYHSEFEDRPSFNSQHGMGQHSQSQQSTPHLTHAVLLNTA